MSIAARPIQRLIALLCTTLFAGNSAALDDAPLLADSLSWAAAQITVEPAAELRLYLRAASDTRYVRRVLLQRDGQVLLDRQLDHPASLALAQGMAMALPALPVPATPLILEIQTSLTSAPPASPYAVERLEFKPRTGVRHFEISLEQGHWLPWRNGLKVQAIDDPLTLLCDSTGFELQRGRAFTAATQLHAIQRTTALPWPARLTLIEARQTLGLDSHIQLQHLSANAPPAVAAQAALMLAEWHAQQGKRAESWQALQQASRQLPPHLHARQLALRVQLDEEMAASLLSDEQLAVGEVALAAFNRIADQPHAGSRKLLERLGGLSMPHDDELGWAVRDQVNLGLGFEYLRHRRPQQASHMFARVRATGPYSAAGRLGLGWAQISPDGGSAQGVTQAATAGAQELGEILRPRGEQDTALARRSTPFRTAHGQARGARADDLNLALQAWVDLVGGDPLNPAVQEAMVAIPYALTHLGAYADAHGRLQFAERELSSLQKRLLESLDAAPSRAWTQALLALADETTADTPLAGPSWWRQARLPEFFYMQHVLADPGLSQTLQQCQHLREARRLLQSLHHADTTAAPQSEKLLQKLQTRSLACNEQLQQARQHVVEGLHRSTGAYLAEARLALARLHDGQADVLAQSPNSP